MVWSDRLLCEMMLRLLERPEYARLAGKRKDIEDMRDILALSPPDEKSSLFGDYFRRNRPLWRAFTLDLNREVLALLNERAKESCEIRQHRPLTVAEEESGTRVGDLFKTLHDLNMKGLAGKPRR